MKKIISKFFIVFIIFFYILLKLSSVTLLNDQVAILYKNNEISGVFYSPGTHYFNPINARIRTVSLKLRNHLFKDFPLKNSKVSAKISWRVTNPKQYVRKFQSEVFASRWIKGMVYHVLKETSYSSENIIKSDELIKRCSKYLIDSGIKIKDISIKISD